MTIKIECSSAKIEGTIDGTVIVTMDFDSDSGEGMYAAEIATVLERLGHGALLAKVRKANEDIMRWNNAKHDMESERREKIEQDLRDTADALVIDTPPKTM
jgi:hypothetical protein